MARISIFKMIRNKLESLCENDCSLDIDLRNNTYFDNYVKNDGRLMKMLKTIMKKENLTEEQALSMLKEKIRKMAINCLTDVIYNLISNPNFRKADTYIVVYGHLPHYRQWYFAWLIHQLIRKGLIGAYYIGPKYEELIGRTKCQGLRSPPDDPWLSDRRKSGEVKIRAFYITADKTQRNKMLSCWAKHIKLDLTKLVKTVMQTEPVIITNTISNPSIISSIEAIMNTANNPNNANATFVISSYNDNVYQNAELSDQALARRLYAPDASVVDSIEKGNDGIMRIPTTPTAESEKPYFVLDNTKSSPKPRSTHKGDKEKSRSNT